MSAADILAKARQHLISRAAARDQVGGARSMSRTVAAFNALTGRQISERDGWLFMALVKAARACTTPTGIPDDYEDGAAYFALAGESAAEAESINSPRVGDLTERFCIFELCDQDKEPDGVYCAGHAEQERRIAEEERERRGIYEPGAASADDARSIS